MTVEEAYAEMKKRGWGFSRSRGQGTMYAIGPIENPDYAVQGVPPIINVYAMDPDPIRAVQKAIEVEGSRNGGSKDH